MNRIDERFAKVKADGRKALITFLTVGDPNMEVSEKAIYTMQEEGVDLIDKTKRKKKIAAAIYEYQADCDGEWGEISFDFENGTAEIIRHRTIKSVKFV